MISSPVKILKGLAEGVNKMVTSPLASESLCHILPHVHPRKNLQEVAWDAGRSLPHVLDTTNLLLRAGNCVFAMPVLRKNQYICADGVVLRMSS